MRFVHALCVHGVGHRTPSNFADKAMRRLSASLSKQGVTLYARSVHWGPVLDQHQERMEREVARLGSSGRPIQRATMGVGGDALSYRHSQEAINHVFDYEARSLRADDFVIFAHSLGVVLATDWLRSRKLARCSRLVSMGCNLQAFNQGAEAQWAQECPWQIAGPGTWDNMWDAEDGLGWPLRGWLPQVQDHEVSVGGWLGWTALAHAGFWGNRKLWQDTIPQVILQA